MKSEALSYFSDTHLTAIALILFLLSFAAIICYAYFRYRKDEVAAFAQIPLQGEES